MKFCVCVILIDYSILDNTELQYMKIKALSFPDKILMFVLKEVIKYILYSLYILFFFIGNSRCFLQEWNSILCIYVIKIHTEISDDTELFYVMCIRLKYNDKKLTKSLYLQM